MTFKKITFLFIALLLSLLLLLQYWLIQSFTKDVSSKIGQAAFEVSRSTIETLIFGQPELQIKKFAFKGNISEEAQVQLINSISRISNEVNISLKDGQKDNFLTINSAGSSYKVDIPRTGIEQSLEQMSNKILLSAIAFIFLGMIAAGYFARKVSKPLIDLQQASERIGRGEFGFQMPNIKNAQSVELKNTLEAFNKMSKQIELLQKENDKLQKQAQLAELAEITRGLAHTIRNPLNTLNLAVDELTSTDEPATKKELSRVAKHQVQRIDKWVRSLMDIMSTDQSLVEMVKVEQLLKSIIEEISLDTKINIPINLSVINQSKNPSSFEIKAIQVELKSLFHSLLNNALEASEPNTKSQQLLSKLKIDVTLSKVGSTIQIAIIDCGRGFSEKVTAKLFSPHNTDKTYGAGMGLYLAHRIATIKYNGDLTISSNKPTNEHQNSGTTVTVVLNNRV